MGYVYNRQAQTHVRRMLRRNPTLGELRLWQELKDEQLGVKFRRQYGIMNAIADFYCPQFRLAIEIDGTSHHQPGARFHDKIRQEDIESFGITVIRFTEADAVHKTESVVEKIRRALVELG